MPQRLADRFQLNDSVEIRFQRDTEDRWFRGAVIGFDPPGIWVQLATGSHFFVTNTRRIRHWQMSHAVIQRLLELNRTFYREFAPNFARSRSQPWPSFERLLSYLPQPCPRFLDVGCGDGRLGRFLLERGAIEEYVGVDFSGELLAIGREQTKGQLLERNLVSDNPLEGLGKFDAIACIATLQHIPSWHNRVNLLNAIAEHLTSTGIFALANWQFQRSQRQQRKIVTWSHIGLADADVEANDYLLHWQRGGLGYRYVNLIDEKATTQLFNATPLHIETHFDSDGREGNLNLYTIASPRG